MTKHHDRVFESVDEFIDFSRPRAMHKKLIGTSRNYRPASWDLGAGWDGALDLAENGWPEGCEKVHKMADKLFGIMKPESHQQDVTYQIDGGTYVDVGRYVEGEPECFGEFSTPKDPIKIIRVEIGGAFTCEVPGRLASNRGAAIIALIDLLEIRGYRCELVVCFGQRSDDGETINSQIFIKDAHRPLNIDRVSFCLAHPAFFRRIWLSSVEQESEELRREFGFHSRGCYGIPTDIKTNEADVYIPIIAAYHLDDFRDEEACVGWIREVIKINKLIKEEETEMEVF